MAGGRRSKLKGNRAERKLVRTLQDAGIAAERIPLSGAMRGKYGGRDLSMPMLGRDCKVEVKHHANGFQRLYRWLAPVDMLMVRCDYADPLVVMPMKLAMELINAAEGKKKGAKALTTHPQTGGVFGRNDVMAPTEKLRNRRR